MLIQIQNLMMSQDKLSGRTIHYQTKISHICAMVEPFRDSITREWRWCHC